MLGLVLAGCTSAPAPPATARAVSAERAWLARGLRQPGLRQWLRAQGASHAPGAAWQLHQLRLVALYYHPDEQLARAGVQLARADLRIAHQWPNPRLQLGIKYQATQAALLPSPWTLGAAIELMLWSRAQRQAQQQRAQAALRAARAMLRASAWRLRLGVDRAFIASWRDTRDLELQSALLRLQRRRLHRLRGLEQQGWASPLRVALALAREQSRQRALLDLRARRAADMLQLAAAIGVPAQALRGRALDLRAFDAAAPAGAPVFASRLAEQALAHRADVRAAWQQLRAADAELRRQIALRDGRPGSVAPGLRRDQGADDLTLRADLPLPLANHHEGQIEAAAARRRQALARLRGVQARASAHFELALLQLRAAARDSRLALARWRRARHLWRIAEAPRTRPWIDPLQRELARDSMLQARRGLLHARARQWLALAALHAALQLQADWPPSPGGRTPARKGMPSLNS